MINHYYNVYRKKFTRPSLCLTQHSFKWPHSLDEKNYHFQLAHILVGKTVVRFQKRKSANKRVNCYQR